MTNVTCPTMTAVLAKAPWVVAHAQKAPKMFDAKNRKENEAVCVMTYLSSYEVDTPEGRYPQNLANTAYLRSFALCAIADCAADHM